MKSHNDSIQKKFYDLVQKTRYIYLSVAAAMFYGLPFLINASGWTIPPEGIALMHEIGAAIIAGCIAGYVFEGISHAKTESLLTHSMSAQTKSIGDVVTDLRSILQPKIGDRILGNNIDIDIRQAVNRRILMEPMVRNYHHVECVFKNGTKEDRIEMTINFDFEYENVSSKDQIYNFILLLDKEAVENEAAAKSTVTKLTYTKRYPGQAQSTREVHPSEIRNKIPQQDSSGWTFFTEDDVAETVKPGQLLRVEFHYKVQRSLKDREEFFVAKAAKNYRLNVVAQRIQVGSQIYDPNISMVSFVDLDAGESFTPVRRDNTTTMEINKILFPYQGAVLVWDATPIPSEA